MSNKTGCQDCGPPGVRADPSTHVLLQPGVDKILDVLSARHRRLILLLLKQGTVETEADVMVRSGNSTREETEITLTHRHLPKLEEAGYIEWDPECGEISKGPHFDEIEPFLELIENHADELPPDWP